MRGHEIAETSTLGQIFKTRVPDLVPMDYLTSFIELHKLPQSYEFPDVKSIVGIEVEVENVKAIDVNVTLAFWRVTDDGSLRNNGKEFVSTPLRSQHIEPALEQLFKGLNSDIDFSGRTSIHVHLNARTFTPDNMCAFVMTYLVLENLLFKYVGNNRRSNIYCVPIQDTSIFDKLPKDWAANTIDHIRRSWSKYTALNLLPLGDKGTVEFRHMPGTTDIKKLLIWITMIQKIKLFAFQHTTKEVIALIGALNTNSEYRIFLERVLGDYYHYLDTSNLQTDMEEAVTLVKHCGISNDYHQNILNGINRESAFGKLIMAYYDRQEDKPVKRGKVLLTPQPSQVIWNTLPGGLTNDMVVVTPTYINAFGNQV